MEKMHYCPMQVKQSTTGDILINIVGSGTTSTAQHSSRIYARVYVMKEGSCKIIHQSLTAK